MTMAITEIRNTWLRVRDDCQIAGESVMNSNIRTDYLLEDHEQQNGEQDKEASVRV